MYNPYNLDLVRVRQQELIAAADRDRAAKAARKARRHRRRALAVRVMDVRVEPAPRVESCSPVFPS